MKNLPFNCDGCSRVLPKLTELAKSLHSQQQRIESCEKKVDDLKGIGLQRLSLTSEDGGWRD